MQFLSIFKRSKYSKCSLNAVKNQSNFSRNSVEIQPKCSQNAAKILSIFCQNSVQMQPKNSQNATKVQTSILDTFSLTSDETYSGINWFTIQCSDLFAFGDKCEDRVNGPMLLKRTAIRSVQARNWHRITSVFCYWKRTALKPITKSNKGVSSVSRSKCIRYNFCLRFFRECIVKLFCAESESVMGLGHNWSYFLGND